MITVSAISIYPIKSTAGIALEHAELQPIGLAHDRRRAIVDAEAGRIVTAREHPRLLAVNTMLQGDQLLVSTPEGAIEIPLAPPGEEISRVKLWADEQHPGIRYPEQVNRWLSDYLGIDCYLIFMGEGCRRAFPTGMASGYTGRLGDAVSYADDYPLLLVSEASLEDLNSRLETPVTMKHFRPNLVVHGCAAYAEDGWQRFRLGECEFELAQACPRCVLTTINPETMLKHAQQEPLRTLASYRRSPGGGAPFGIQIVPRRLGVVRLGDVVEPI